MILLHKHKTSKSSILAIDFSKALWFAVESNAIRLFYEGAELGYTVYLKDMLSDEEKEQLAYYLSVMKNKDDVMELEKLIKAVKKEAGDNENA